MSIRETMVVPDSLRTGNNSNQEVYKLAGRYMQVITETVKVYPAVRGATSNLHLCMKNRSVAIES